MSMLANRLFLSVGLSLSFLYYTWMFILSVILVPTFCKCDKNNTIPDDAAVIFSMGTWMTQNKISHTFNLVIDLVITIIFLGEIEAK